MITKDNGTAPGGPVSLMRISDGLPNRVTKALQFMGKALRPPEEDAAADQFSQLILKSYADSGIATPA
jgi:hypothetical protein